MTDCSRELFDFPTCRRRRVEADFGGGEVSSDGGALLIRQADRRIGLLAAVAKAIDDPRVRGRCAHSQLSLLRQRVYGICLGYEDLNDHATLRGDAVLQTSVERDRILGSSATLCRLENRMDRAAAWAIHRVLIEQFIASHEQAPEELVLDFDATDDPVHGNQEGRFFHGYYDTYCFLPLYVFCGERLLVSYLRPSRIEGAKHAWAVLSLLVKRLRQAWPEIRIVFRGDSGFCRHRMLSWCDRHQVSYVVGLAKNDRLNAMAASWLKQAEVRFEKTKDKQRLFGEIRYAAGTWTRERRVIAKAEHSAKGTNPRYVVTNLKGNAQAIYEDIYCARGEMENRIKETQLGLFADRTSCHRWWPNQFRVLLSSLAYALMETIRRVGLAGTELAKAQCTTLRLKLLKIGAVVIRNSRRVRLWLSSSYPYQELFFLVARRLVAT